MEISPISEVEHSAQVLESYSFDFTRPILVHNSNSAQNILMLNKYCWGNRTLNYRNKSGVLKILAL